tara:strand:- start:251 stop:862 length:612 start_codon:yes stop_codon:yes gene_type:complete
MQIAIEKRFVIGFMFAYTAIFSVYALLNRNFEFVYYTVIMIVLILYIYKKQHSLWLSNNIVVGLAIIGLLHIFGGGFSVDGTRIYDLTFYNTIRYDNLVHGFSMFVITFVSYNLIRPIVSKRLLRNRIYFVLLIFLVSLGIGAVNEIIEFIAVILFDAGFRVGDFYNTGWDLIFNSVGILAALAFIPPFSEDRVHIKLKKKWW